MYVVGSSITELSVKALIHAYTLTRSLTHSSLSLSLSLTHTHTHKHIYIHSHTLFQTHFRLRLAWKKDFYRRINHKLNLITTAKHDAFVVRRPSSFTWQHELAKFWYTLLLFAIAICWFPARAANILAQHLKKLERLWIKRVHQRHHIYQTLCEVQ